MSTVTTTDTTRIAEIDTTNEDGTITNTVTTTNTISTTEEKDGEIEEPETIIETTTVSTTKKYLDENNVSVTIITAKRKNDIVITHRETYTIPKLKNFS